MKITGIYLAAGKSRRMGRHKLSLPVGETTLGSLALTSFLKSRVERVLVVTGEKDDLAWLDPALHERPWSGKWQQIRCGKSELGQAYSLCCGIEAARNDSPDAVITVLADQPFVTPAMIDQLILAYEQSRQQGRGWHYIASGDQGIVKPPILWSRDSFDALLELRGDEGARRLIKKGVVSGIVVEFPDPELFFDVDTPEDYERCKLLMERRAHRP